jgi:hypothetical protein
LQSSGLYTLADTTVERGLIREMLMNDTRNLTIPFVQVWTRGVQIRSESDPIGFVRISEQKYTFRIGLIKLFRSWIGSDFDIRNKMN